MVIMLKHLGTVTPGDCDAKFRAVVETHGGHVISADGPTTEKALDRARLKAAKQFGHRCSMLVAS